MNISREGAAASFSVSCVYWSIDPLSLSLYLLFLWLSSMTNFLSLNRCGLIILFLD